MIKSHLLCQLSYVPTLWTNILYQTSLHRTLCYSIGLHPSPALRARSTPGGLPVWQPSRAVVQPLPAMTRDNGFAAFGLPERSLYAGSEIRKRQQRMVRSMRIVLTAPMRKRITPELRGRIERALNEFPELAGHRITVGATRAPGLHGNAEGDKLTIRLNTRRRIGVTYFTIGHELTHLLQKPGLGIVPSGETACDIWTLSRSELFLDEIPAYLGPLSCSAGDWGDHAKAVRLLCIQAIQVRKTNRLYITWLQARLREHFEKPKPRPADVS